MTRMMFGASVLALSLTLLPMTHAQAPAPAMEAFETGQWGRLKARPPARPRMWTR